MPPRKARRREAESASSGWRRRTGKAKLPTTTAQANPGNTSTTRRCSIDDRRMSSGLGAKAVSSVSDVCSVRLIVLGVSPLRGAGLLRCASSRCQRPSVSPLRAAIHHAGSPPPSALAGAHGGADCGPAALSVRSPMQRSRLRLHRDAQHRGQAGGAGGMTTAARSRDWGSRALIPSRVRERGPLDELTGVPFTPLCFVRCTPARSSPPSPAMPDAGPLNAMK